MLLDNKLEFERIKTMTQRVLNDNSLACDVVSQVLVKIIVTPDIIILRMNDNISRITLSRIFRICKLHCEFTVDCDKENVACNVIVELCVHIIIRFVTEIEDENLLRF